MAWYKVDDRLPTSRKVIRIPRSQRAAAIGIWTLAGAWSAHDLTDGWIPAYMIEEWGGDEAHAEALISAGLWARADRDGDPGYQFVNWSEYQPTRVSVEARREREREKKRGQRRDPGGKFAGQDTVPHVSPGDNTGTPLLSPRESTVPVPSRPVPKEGGASRATRLPDTWHPTPEHESRARESGVDIGREVVKFRTHAEDKGRTSKSWNAAFTQWLIKAAEYAARDGRNTPPAPGGSVWTRGPV